MATPPTEVEKMPPVFFTKHSHQILSSCIHLLGVSFLSYCLAHRVPSLSSWRQWTSLTWGRLSVLLLLFDSWLFIFFTGVLVNGVGLSFSHRVCALAIYTCISFYGLTKVLIYGFLVEKMYIVWSAGNRIARLSSTAYRICAVVLLGYVAIVVLMVVGQNSWIRQDGICIIGLKHFATIPMISYDLFLNVFLTAMFVWPLRRSNVMIRRLRNVATRTLYGACVSLTTSALNITVLLALGGEEYGWVCLASCVTDVALNALAINWVTATSYANQNVTVDRYSIPTIDVAPLTLVQQRKEQDFPVSTITQTSQAGSALSPLASYYDYLPRDQRPQDCNVNKPVIEKGWFSRLRDMSRPDRDLETPTPLVAGSANRATQSSGPSGELTSIGLTEVSSVQSHIWLSRSCRPVETQPDEPPRVTIDQPRDRRQVTPEAHGTSHYRRASESDCGKLQLWSMIQ